MNREHQRQIRQRGSVLLMTMMIMLIFIFSGLFVMEMAILDEISVSNEQRTMEVYQVAYGELEVQLAFLENRTDIFNDAITTDQVLTVISNPTGCTTPGQVCQSATLRFIGETPPPPGYSIADFIGLMFELDSIATLDSIGAQSDQTVGFTYVAQRGSI